VLGRRLAHFGVDYAAPPGTPVRATADGVVSFVGFKGGGGNTVELRHAGGYSTAYLHLSRFAPGIKVGARVTQGQVIGFVGATGLATGPHLDYRVMQHGRYLNPARIGADPLPPLTGGELEAFKKARAELAALFAQKGDALDPRSLPFLAAVYGPAR
jgi:murein DD-endopeptidase MepM/ murein hydrolase activator NlpD